jgi:hypothetical protein
MATPMHTQPSTVARQPVSPPHYGEEPGSRIAQDAIPYQGPSQRNYNGRFRLMLGIIGVIFLVSIALTIRLLTDGGL